MCVSLRCIATHKAVLIIYLFLILGLKNRDRHAGGNITGCSSEPGSDLLKGDKLTEILGSHKLAQSTSRWRQGMHALCIKTRPYVCLYVRTYVAVYVCVCHDLPIIRLACIWVRNPVKRNNSISNTFFSTHAAHTDMCVCVCACSSSSSSHFVIQAVVKKCVRGCPMLCVGLLLTCVHECVTLLTSLFRPSHPVCCLQGHLSLCQG